MVRCQIQPASLYAFPRGPASVEDRRMSLATNCPEPATYSNQLLGASAGPARKNAPVKEFLLCENHSQLVAQVDRELGEERWSTVFAEKPRFLT